jgi:D-amino-acid dehydrogenase
MLRKVPSWLSDPLGPLTVRPAYLPRAAPWLVRWIAAGRLDRVRRISTAMRALHAGALQEWRTLLGDAAYRDLIRPAGHLHVWESAEESVTARIDRENREANGVRSEVLGPDEIRQLAPGISRDVVRGVLVPGNAHTVNPARLIQTLAETFRAEGGELVPESALKLIPQEGGGWAVMTNIGTHRADRLVVAGGAWSGRLLTPLGLRLPLETERGYHAMLPGASISLRLPVLHKGRGFGLTPMEEGIRVAGTVEIAGLDAPPQERRALILAENARRLFPGMESGAPKVWMGHRPSFPDSLPVVGAAPRHANLFLCFGHSHFGMTGGPPSGRLVAEIAAGRPAFIDPTPYAATRFGTA